MKLLTFPNSELHGSALVPPALSFEEGKGHVSVNPVYGCGLGCPYCVNLADGVDGARRTLAPVGGLLDTLERNAALVRGLRLSVLDFCDPFDRSVAPVLRELLSGLADRLPGQAVLLTTRLHPGLDALDWLASLRLRLSLFVSLGDATGRVAPVTSVERRLALLAESRVRGLHTVMLLRPLVREWSDPAPLRRLLAHADACCDEVVLAGLTRSPEIDASLASRGWPVPGNPGSAVDPALLGEVLALAAEMLPTVPISEHRSCAINRRHGLPCLVLRTARTGSGPAAPTLCRFPDVRAGSKIAVPMLCRCMNDVRTDETVDPRGYCRLRCAA